MNATNILNGLLESSQRATQAGIQMAEDRALLPPEGEERTAMLKGAGAGALAAGAVALLFGSKGTRKFVKKAAKFGGTAAVGGLAYTAYTQWQAQQGSVQAGVTGELPPPSSVSPSPSLNLDQFTFGTPIGHLPEDQEKERSEALIQAMISAARADGHVDGEEMDMITQQIGRLGLEDDVARFLLAEMNQPLDVKRIAARADTPETAAELYIASALVVDFENEKERGYLDKLATALSLDAALVAELEAPMRA